MKIIPVYNAPDNELVRLGFGRYEGRWFIRLDLWLRGWRVTQ